MKFEVKRRKIVLATMFLISILLASVGSYLAGAASVASKNIYLDDLPAGATYTIKTDGSNVWAVKYDGSIPWSSTDASTVFQSVIDLSPAKIYVTDGNYLINTNLMFYGKTNLIFEGQSWQTKLYTTANGYILRVSLSSENIHFKNLWLYGDGDAGKTSQTGIGIANAANIYVENCKIENLGYDGIHMLTNVTNCHVLNNFITGCKDDGINPGGLGFDDVTGTLISNNRVTNCVNDGIHISDGSENSTVTANTVVSCKNGIGIYNSSFNIISDNTIQGSSQYGIATLIGTCASQTIVNNRIYNSASYGINLQHNSYYSIVKGNLIDTADRGIYVIAYNDTISGNTIRNIVNYGLVVSGGGNYFHIITDNRIDDAKYGFLVNAKNCTVSNNVVSDTVNYSIAEDAGNSDGNIYSANIASQIMLIYGVNSRVSACRNGTSFVGYWNGTAVVF